MDIQTIDATLNSYAGEINNFISNQMTLREAGILRVSQITLKLEEIEFELQKIFDKALDKYIEADDKYSNCVKDAKLNTRGGENKIIDIASRREHELSLVMKEKAKVEMNRLNKIKKLKKKWHDWMNDMFSYV